MKPFTSFYDSIGFAPTRQAPSHADTHHERRAGLYRSLGIPGSAIRGSRVLEFGPGSGENCESVLLHRPSSYTLVDGSTAVLDGVRERLRGVDGVSLAYALSDIEHYADDDQYDLVICEGVLPLQRDPKAMARHILRFARPGAVVVMTCFDSASGFSEVCRRYVAKQEFGDLSYSPGLVARMTEFFAPDLGFLPGMSRRPEDWVIDTLINPWVGEFFSIRDALDVARGRAVFLGSSPRFFQDWRWYKDPSHLDHDGSLGLIDAWLARHSYMFLDTRIAQVQSVEVERLAALPALTTRVADRIKRHIDGDRDYAPREFARDVDAIADVVGGINADTHASLQGLVAWAESGEAAKLAPFRSLWGRAQQFVSLVTTAPAVQR
jgi:ubiquinone/menaquinone biosynthesis C-methylase UbiE